MSRRISRTKYVELNPALCRACWMCLDACKSSVINKVDIFFHKHARLGNIDNCSGCMRCVKTCGYGAFTKLNAVNMEKLLLAEDSELF